jgi:hypothetical protein
MIVSIHNHTTGQRLLIGARMVSTYPDVVIVYPHDYLMAAERISTADVSITIHATDYLVGSF